jgi:hypothetical protein
MDSSSFTVHNRIAHFTPSRLNFAVYRSILKEGSIWRRDLFEREGRKCLTVSKFSVPMPRVTKNG